MGTTTRRGTTVYYSDTLDMQTCGKCGIVFAAPENFWVERKADGKAWYCPNGHGRVFSERTETVLRRQLQAERDRAAGITAALDQTTASLRATKGVVTKQKRKLNRVANGVCPCCNRSFADLRRHMESKHPEFTRQ